MKVKRKTKKEPSGQLTMRMPLSMIAGVRRLAVSRTVERNKFTKPTDIIRSACAAAIAEHDRDMTAEEMAMYLAARGSYE